jgi:dihydroxy-acid dehydratase
MCIGHVAPEAAVGGPIALVKDGDPVEIDIEAGRIHIDVPPEELEKRRAAFRAPVPRYTTGVLAKFAKLATSASKGARCVT